MPATDAQLYFTAVILLGGFLVVLTLSVVTFWQSTHCMWCNRWLPWKSVKDLKYVCENKGTCNLERLARAARKGA